MKLFVTIEKTSIFLFNEVVKLEDSKQGNKQHHNKKNYRFPSNEERLKQKSSHAADHSSQGITYKKVCSFTVNSLSTIVECSEEGDNAYSLMVGSVQLHGVNNANLICFGDPHLFDIKSDFRSRYDSGDPDYGISMNLRVFNHFLDPHSSLSGKFATKLLFLSDISGRVSQSFFKPSSRKVVMELRIKEVGGLWDMESISMLQQLGKELEGPSSLVAKKTDLNTSSNLSELSCKFYKNGNYVVQEKFRMSIEVVVYDVRLLFGLNKPVKNIGPQISPPVYGSHLELASQKFYFCTGDYLDSALPSHIKSNAGDNHHGDRDNFDSDNDGDNPDDSPQFDYDPILRAGKIVWKERNTLVRPRLLMVEGVCIRYSSCSPPSSSSSSKRIPILSPWNVCSIWIPSFSKAHEQFTDNRFDVFCADLKMLVDTKVSDEF
jgi:hypothetical protein